jgi:hypothetical protein
MLKTLHMKTRPLRFATCTPVAFHANEYFYTRDTGLICKELQRLGAHCRVIMPLPEREDDLPTHDLLRVPRHKLSSSAWWKGLGVDAVILYSWGDPRYTSIAKAIRKAGLKLIIHFDSSGELHEHLQRSGNKIINRIKDYIINKIRSLHLSYAHTITASLPCMNAFRSDTSYGDSIADKCQEFPTPVNSCFQYDGEEKEERIICTGNWCNAVKRADMLTCAIQKVLTAHSSVQVDICGSATPEMQRWHAALPMHMQQRTHLHGMCTHEQLSRLYKAARISLCTSESEGSHAASAEALCCGCSVVCPPRPLLNVVQWYTNRDSGTVSAEDTADSLSLALCNELEEWQRGTRNPHEISAVWSPCFQVANLMTMF